MFPFILSMKKYYNKYRRQPAAQAQHKCIMNIQIFLVMWLLANKEVLQTMWTASWKSYTSDSLQDALQFFDAHGIIFLGKIDKEATFFQTLQLVTASTSGAVLEASYSKGTYSVITQKSSHTSFLSIFKMELEFLGP